MHISSFETTIDATDATVWVVTPVLVGRVYELVHEKVELLGDIEVVVSGDISRPEADDDITPGSPGWAEVDTTETIIDGELRTIELPHALEALVAEQLYQYWAEGGE